MLLHVKVDTSTCWFPYRPGSTKHFKKKNYVHWVFAVITSKGSQCMGYGQALHAWGQNLENSLEVWNALSISEAIIIIPDDIHNDALASSLEILNNASTGVEWVSRWIHIWIWLVSNAKSSEATNWCAQHLFRTNCLRSAVAHIIRRVKKLKKSLACSGIKIWRKWHITCIQRKNLRC